MRITLELPDDLAAHLLPPGQDPARAALELLALEGYRTQRLNEHQLRIMLGYQIRMEVHAFLAAHVVPCTTPWSISSRTSKPPTNSTPNEPPR